MAVVMSTENLNYTLLISHKKIILEFYVGLTCDCVMSTCAQKYQCSSIAQNKRGCPC